MSKLIQIRQRIKAIETIKKVTHAMRLISMSSHSRLRAKQEQLQKYRNEIHTLFSKLQTFAPEWQNKIINPTNKKTTLFILVGSQKGLCGTFNANLFSKFPAYLAEDTSTDFTIIGVGKKAVDYLHAQYPSTITKTFDTFTTRTMISIALDLTDTIMEQQIPYARVVMVSNEFSGFFKQKPRASILIPSHEATLEKTNMEAQAPPVEGYIWKHQANKILDVLARQYIEAQIYSLLFESMLAEQAARFVSMDSSTRNAQSLLESTKLGYNKLRQAIITKELTELSSNFQ